MALALFDRVQQTGTANTTVSFTLTGSVVGFQSFAAIGNGNTTFYTAIDVSGNWETGLGTYSTTGPTLTRTAIFQSSNANAAVTFSGAVNVWVDYPSSKSVNLDASGNVSALGTVTSGTWNAGVIPVAYGGTGVTTSSGASSVVLRDSNANVTFNNFTANAAVVTASAGTTVLTVASARTQLLVGSTTHTFQLPNATTLVLGQSFLFINNSSGLLTVKDNASTTVEEIPPGGITQLGAVSIATSAGSWGPYSFIPAACNWGTNSLNLATTVISGGTWQGGTIDTGYGGTGLTSYTSGGAVYASSGSTLTSGTLPVGSGGTGQTTFASGYIPYGNTTAALQSSASLVFNGTYLVVGGTAPLGGATNPITAFSSSANNFVQTYVYNDFNGVSSSADFVAYANNSDGTTGFVDMGFTSLAYADATYSVTGPNESYLFGSAASGSGTTGNLVYATDSTGTANAHQWYVGGFNQAKSAWKMQLNSTGLSLPGNLTFTGTGNRITGDFSNGTLASRVMFQTSTTNGATNVFALPNGTGTTAGYTLVNNSDPSNASLTQLVILSTESSVRAAISGTGTYLPMTFYTGGSERMRIDTSGNVGVGTSSPSSKLDVNGKLTLTGGEDNQLQLTNNSQTWRINNSTGGQFYLYDVTATKFPFKVNAGASNDSFVISSSGNVGIGTNSPAVKLDVAGTIRSTSVTIASASTITPTSDTTNQYTVTALAVPATIAIPSGTPIDGQKLTIRIKDNGTARALTWTTTSGGYRVIGTTLPTTTVATKTIYVGCIYNSFDSFWDVVAVATQA
jgi:hypothetical protein